MNNSAEPSSEQIALVLSRINAGLRQTWSQISELASSLERMLKDAHALADPHIPAERRAAWDQSWRDLRENFAGIRACDAEAQKHFNSANPAADPLEPWNDVLSREESFNHSLSEIRETGDQSLPAGDHAVWDDFCQGIERQIAMLEAHAMTIRFQLELREKYGHEKADALTRSIAARLPKDADIAEAKKYGAEYRQAWQEFEHEKENVGSVWDVLKSLMLVQPKSPQERVEAKYPQRLQRPAV